MTDFAKQVFCAMTEFITDAGFWYVDPERFSIIFSPQGILKIKLAYISGLWAGEPCLSDVPNSCFGLSIAIDQQQTEDFKMVDLEQIGT